MRRAPAYHKRKSISDLSIFENRQSGCDISVIRSGGLTESIPSGLRSSPQQDWGLVISHIAYRISGVSVVSGMGWKKH